MALTSEDLSNIETAVQNVIMSESQQIISQIENSLSVILNNHPITMLPYSSLDGFFAEYSQNGYPSSGGSSDLSGIENTISTINTNLNTVKTDVSTIKSNSATIKSDTATLKTDTTAIKSDTSTLKTDTTTIKEDITTIIPDISTIKSSVTFIKDDTQYSIVDGMTSVYDAVLALDSFDLSALDTAPITDAVVGAISTNISGLIADASLNGYGAEFKDGDLVVVSGRDVVYSVIRSFFTIYSENAYTVHYNIESTDGQRLIVPEALLTKHIIEG